DGASAFGLVGPGPGADRGGFRQGTHQIPSLPRVLVRIAVPPDPVLRFGARLLYAGWRDVGLGPRFTGESSRADASFRRLLAVYPQAEAILAELALRDGGGPRSGLGHALASTDQKEDLKRPAD